MISMRDTFAKAVRVAAAKHRASECMASDVPRAIDVARELRGEWPDVTVDDVRMLARLANVRLADGQVGDSQRPPKMPRPDSGEWAKTMP